MKPRKHAELIKQWADGAEVQAYEGKKWVDVIQPTWASHYEYRIKPDEPKPPVVRWLWADENGAVSAELMSEDEVQARWFPIKLEWSRTEFPE